MSGSTDTPSLSELVREGCVAADTHLRCSYPDCTCKQIPNAIKAVLSRLSGNGGGAATPSASLEEDLAEALVIIAGHGIEPDVQELLVYGNPSRGIKRGALAAVIRAFKAQAASERLSPPNLEPQCGVVSADPIIARLLKVLGRAKYEGDSDTWHATVWGQQRLDASEEARNFLQAASAAAPKPIDDGAVERISEHRLAEIAAFPVAGHDWCADLAVPYVKIGKHDLDELIRVYRAALQAVQTKT